MKPILALLRPRHDGDVDRLMLLVLSAGLVLGLGLSIGRPQAATAIALALGAGTVLGLVVWRWPGSATSRWAIALGLVACVAWHVQLGGGRPALHATVYLALSLLLAYRDWRVLLGTAALFIGHHLLFGLMQARGLPVDLLRGTVEPPSWLHLSIIALQALLLAPVAWREQLAAREARELEVLVQAMGREGQIRLNLAVMRAETRAGQRLQQVQQRMAGAMLEVRAAGQLVAEAAERVAGGSRELLRRTDDTASGLKDSSVCLDQIGVIVQHNTEASNEAQAMSTRAAAMADDGNRLVADVVRSMQAIEVSSRRIHEITAVIDTIAFQTNILALNAAVEAARAGEQGRGFAVVAGEVRALAQRSAAAAREIKALIGESVDTVAHGTQLVNGAGSTMTELVSSVRRVGELFQSMMADTTEQMQGLHTVSESIAQLSQTTQQNVAVAEGADRAAADLRAQAERLGSVLSAFRLPDDVPAALAAAAASETAAPQQPSVATGQAVAGRSAGAVRGGPANTTGKASASTPLTTPAPTPAPTPATTTLAVSAPAAGQGVVEYF